MHRSNATTMASAQTLRRRFHMARQQLEALQVQMDGFFKARPFRIDAAPDERRSDHDLHRFRMTRRIPRGVQWKARRLLRNIRKLNRLLGAAAPESSVLGKLAEMRVSIWHPPLVPGVRAGTTLLMTGDLHTGSATLHAPIFDARRREITVVRQDPDSQLRGSMEVRFHFEFAGAADFSGRSCVEPVAVALKEVERLLADGAEITRAGPVAAARIKRTESRHKGEST